MKAFKIALSTGIIILALNGIAQNNDGQVNDKSPEERAQQQTEKMTEHLDLDEKQQNLVAGINLDFARQAQKISEGAKNKEQLKALKESKKKALDAVLTPEQMTKLNAFHERKMTQMREGRSNNASPDERAKHQTKKMTELLELDETQQNLVAEINLNFARHAQKIRESATSKEEGKEKIEALHESKKKQLEAVLTQEQMEKLTELHERRKGQKKERIEEHKKQ